MVRLSIPVVTAYVADVRPGLVVSPVYDMAADRWSVLALFHMSVMPPGCIATFRGWFRFSRVVLCP